MADKPSLRKSTGLKVGNLAGGKVGIWGFFCLLFGFSFHF